MAQDKERGNGYHDLKIEDIKAIFPESAMAPLISGAIDSGNAGVRLLSNDETITEMLKGLNFNDEAQAASCAFALGENEIFLYNEDGKINKEVERIRNRIKYRATAQCSVKGLWVDQYKQAAIGVATSTSTPHGFQPLPMPFGKKYDDKYDGNNNKSSNNKRP